MHDHQTAIHVLNIDTITCTFLCYITEHVLNTDFRNTKIVR